MRRPRWLTERCLGVLRLGLLVVAGWGVWLLLLPRVARWPVVQERIARDEHLGVDPSAKFYTELPAMPRVVDRLEAMERRRPGAFW